MAAWNFRPQRPDEKVRDPILGEYFDEEAIDLPAQALVREVIQNSLDARAAAGPVKVRFYVSEEKFALSPERAARWLTGAWAHLLAPGSGLRDLPTRPERCPFLLVEDFATIGLEGDPTEWHLPSTGVKNHFFAFFRAEAVSENTGGRGKWGVGKTVFQRSSRINTLFGLTVRNSDRRHLLMGQSVLRYHELGGTHFSSDGMFGRLSPNGVVLPVEESSALEEFARDFRLNRVDEPGLSAVVPYCHEEITRDAVLQAVAREYFFPILTGKLSVVVDGPDPGSAGLTLDSNTLLDSIESEDNALPEEIRAVVDLAVWSQTLLAREIPSLEIAAASGRPEWSRELFPESTFASLAERFAKGERVAVRVPIRVRTATGHERDSNFEVFLQQDLDGRGYPPVFIRNSIIVPKALERRVRGHHLRALVIIDHQHLASLLGDAETPAHTQWSHKTQNFRDKYAHGPAYLEFVRSAPRQIAEILSAAAERRDRRALADYFPRPAEEGGLPDHRDRKKPPKGEGPDDPEPPESGTKVSFVIEWVRGGFRIKRGDPSAPLPRRLEIRVAYDRSRGNPLAKYHPADFRLESLARAIDGVEEVACRENGLIVDVLDEGFTLEVRGFDENRDVYVRAREVGRGDD